MVSRPAVVTCRPLRLAEVRKLPPLRSGYETDRVFRLSRSAEAGCTCWRLREEAISPPFRKLYDSGRPDEWLASYEETVRPQDLRFAAAYLHGKPCGLITWQVLGWNSTVWLVDIRTDEGARRKGIGSALVDYVKEVARTERARGISVETQINNYPAIRFYQRHGFEVAGFNDHLYTNHDLVTQDVAVYLFWETG
jgi:ribosomal protein S18 acetylase RimI-like enzyme